MEIEIINSGEPGEVGLSRLGWIARNNLPALRESMLIPLDLGAFDDDPCPTPLSVRAVANCVRYLQPAFLRVERGSLADQRISCHDTNLDNRGMGPND